MNIAALRYVAEIDRVHSITKAAQNLLICLLYTSILNRVFGQKFRYFAHNDDLLFLIISLHTCVGTNCNRFNYNKSITLSRCNVKTYNETFLCGVVIDITARLVYNRNNGHFQIHYQSWL